MSDRRSFIAKAAGATAALLTFPDRVLAQRPPRASASDYWSELRKEFLIPPGEAFFNTGTLGSSPRVVLDAVVQHMTHVDRDIAHWDYKPDHENFFTGYYPELPVRRKIAQLINATPEEIALTQNATFGMNFVANGLDLHVGDEVIVIQNAHPGGRCGWELRDKRYGANVKYVTPNIPPKDPQELIDLYERATTPQTRVWAIPHLSSTAAILFPVAEMCKRARERNIISIVDGAQTCGHLAIDVKAMGCDAYFTSPHKWLLAPKGTGFLYVRKETLPRVWATLASAEWDNHRDGAYRLMQYGTGNLSLLVGLEKAIDFHMAIGSQRVEQRVIGLADRLRTGLQKIDGVVINSSLHPQMRTGTTIWSVRGKPAVEIQDYLWNTTRVRVRSMSDALGVRQCCHIYNSEAEVDRTLNALQRMVARG